MLLFSVLFFVKHPCRKAAKDGRIMTKDIVSMLVTPDGAAQKTEFSRQTSRKIANDLTADMQKATDYIIKKGTKKQSRISAKEKNPCIYAKNSTNTAKNRQNVSKPQEKFEENHPRGEAHVKIRLVEAKNNLGKRKPKGTYWQSTAATSRKIWILGKKLKNSLSRNTRLFMLQTSAMQSSHCLNA